MMSQIILDDEQAKVLTDTRETVELVDRTGRRLGYVASTVDSAPQSEREAIEEDVRLALQRRGDGRPRLTTRQVLEGLAALERSS